MAGKISPTQWAEIATAWKRREKSLRELAEEHGVTKQYISQELAKRGIERNSDLAEIAGEDEGDSARRDREERVATAKKKQSEYSKYNDVIVQLTMKRVIEGSKANGSLSSKHKDLIVLGNASKILERARKENWEILQIEDLLGEGEDLPDLNVGEYSDDDLAEIREAQERHYVESNDLDIEDEAGE